MFDQQAKVAEQSCGHPGISSQNFLFLTVPMAQLTAQFPYGKG